MARKKSLKRPAGGRPRRKRRRQNSFRLVLTGQRRKGRILLIVDGREAWLPHCEVEALWQLIEARAVHGTTGYVRLAKQLVYRLRRSCAQDAPLPELPPLVESVGGGEYGLAVAIRQVTRDDSFAELPVPRLITAELRVPAPAIAPHRRPPPRGVGPASRAGPEAAQGVDRQPDDARQHAQSRCESCGSELSTALQVRLGSADLRRRPPSANRPVLLCSFPP